jgi:hypothetical protein
MASSPSSPQPLPVPGASVSAAEQGDRGWRAPASTATPIRGLINVDAWIRALLNLGRVPFDAGNDILCIPSNR